MRFRLPLFVAVATLLLASFASAQTCSQVVIDKAGVIQNPTMVQNAARTLLNQGADVHVVTIASIAQYGANLQAVETFIESKCPSWTTNGVRKANLFVVMVAPNDRQKNMFLGSYYAGAFDVTSTYSQASNAYFKNKQWDAGLASALTATTNTAIAFHQHAFQQQQAARTTTPVYTPPVRTYTPTNPTPTYTTPQTADSSGVSGFTIFLIVVVILLLVAAVLYFLFRESNETTTTTTDTIHDNGYGSRASYTPRAYGAAAPTHTTTVIDNTRYDSSGNLLTGVLIGEALSRPNYQPPAPSYNPPAPVYAEPTPTYVPDPTPVADAPDSSWEEPTQQAPDTDFGSSNNDTPSFDPPSSDFGSSGDSGF